MAVEASEQIATRLLNRIMEACEQPRHFPESGAARDYLAPGLRVTFSGNYAAYYTHTPREVLIVRVFHGARDAMALAGRGAFE